MAMKRGKSQKDKETQRRWTKYDEKAYQISEWSRKKIRKWRLIMFPIMLPTLVFMFSPLYISSKMWWAFIIGGIGFPIERAIYERNVSNTPRR